jgi:hypothetical protein
MLMKMFLLGVSELSKLLKPSIPVQTISTDTAAMILRHLHSDDGVTAPSSWTGGLDRDYFIGRKFNSEFSS